MQTLALNGAIARRNHASLVAHQKSMTSKTSFQVVPFSEVPTPMTCDEKGRLLRQYDEATLAFSNAVQELRRKIGTSAKDEYERLERISNEARVKSRANTISARATHRHPSLLTKFLPNFISESIQ